jgi:hypothetical protein
VQATNEVMYKGRVIVNPLSAIQLAFVLGIRFGLAYPNQAGDYMGAFLREHKGDEQTEDLAIRHQHTVVSCTAPLLDPTWSEHD